ncbi:unnamed protein product [Brassicogethes aeneus]|uniref:MADF domain-containing protein n=1 Tax=Brassicogethes aeneus TaxID=1431903 RepID=A0A9P0BEL7_BRAAE|nr:unnamed protein product [Brassicogethes aeneus]
MNHVNTDDPIFNIKFLQLIKNRPCLWNYSLSEYSKRHIIEKVWKEVAGEMKDSVKAVPFVKMPLISIENRIKIIETYNENGRWVKTTYRIWWINLNLPIPRPSQQLGLSTMTKWRILRKDLFLKPYKVQLVQELKPADHYVRQTTDLLQTKFPDRVISRNFALNWPPRSCDLTPLDYFLWGYVKDQVYADNPLTIEALKANIERAIREIEPQLCQNVITNFNKRIDVLANCRERWRNIRTSYLRSLKKPSSGSSTKKPYYLAGYLDFILPYTKRKTTIINMEELFDNNETSEEDNSEFQENTENTENQELPSQSQAVSVPKKQKVTQIPSSSSNPVDDSLLEWLENKKERDNFKKEEPNMSFFRSLLPDVMKMTDKQNRRFRQKVIGLIDEILDDADIRQDINLL